MSRLVIAEKPSVAQSIASVLGAVNRKDGYLFHGDYDYDPGEPADMLNFRPPMEAVLGELEQYRLFQQQTQGGIYHILCKRYELIEG